MKQTGKRKTSTADINDVAKKEVLPKPLQPQPVTVQAPPQIVLLKPTKAMQQSPQIANIQPQIVPRVIAGPRPIRLKGQQQPSILQVQNLFAF